jgi:hypothetical protein
VLFPETLRNLRQRKRIRRIQKAVAKAAKCPIKHTGSAVVVESFTGKILWKGAVEIFALEGHAKAKRAYGWSFGQGANASYTAVLEIPPVNSPTTAVRASMASEAWERQGLDRRRHHHQEKAQENGHV